MAAIFYNPSSGPDIFRSDIHVNTSVWLPFLEDLIGEQGFLIVSDVTVSINDIVQYFVTFDDVISYFYFGKGLGTISISGSLFVDCNLVTRGIDDLYNRVAFNRGSIITVGFGNVVFDGVIASFTTSAKSEPADVVDFNIQLNIIDHSLPVRNFNPSC